MSGHRVAVRTERPGFVLDVDVLLPRSGITVVYGPSGSGKTSLLRCLAGLERAAQAHVSIQGQVWQDSASGVWLPTHKRPVGYVFQEASLFAHLDVAGNLEFARRRAAPVRDGDGGSGSGSALLDPAYAVRILGLEHLLQRRTDALSGGERQRVAIARALATRPALLLLDEPLASLDGARRLEVLPWLERLRDELDIPMVYVSHAADEVTRLADTLLVLQDGRVQACGLLQDVMAQTQPALHIGDDVATVVSCRVLRHDAPWHLTEVGFEGGSFWLSDSGLQLGAAVRLRVLARDVSVATVRPTGLSIQNLVQAIVCEITPDTHPAQALLRLQCGRIQLLSRVTQRAVQQLGLAVGQQVWAQVKAMALIQ